MMVRDAIERYLSHQQVTGKKPGSVRTTAHALRTVLAPVLEGELVALGAEGVGDLLRTALGQRLSRTSKKPLTKCTQELILNAAGAFLSWCIGQGWLKTNALTPARMPPPAPHWGTLIRKLRLAAGLASWTFGEQIGMNEVTVKALERGLFRPTRAQLDRLLTHPTMAALPPLAKKAGLELPKDEPDLARVEGDKP